MPHAPTLRALDTLTSRLDPYKVASLINQSTRDGLSTESLDTSQILNNLDWPALVDEVIDVEQGGREERAI